ncbi:response regulator [Methanobacterium sp.]|uniref:response regulator n=1 Tax=Methanobacterium sp. TaxID=2164 RepID=UPI003C7227EB
MSNARILVVEDERITAEDIKDGLKSLGYEVPAVVHSGEEAVRKAKELQPDLVLMDIKLEGKMDGIEAAGEIKKYFDIPVIYLTAYSDENTLERARMTEPSGYVLKEPSGFVHKPFKESELHTIIELTLYRHKMEKNHDQWLSTMLESVNEALIATDENGKIRFMNHIAEDLTGWINEEAVNKDLIDVFKIQNGEFESNEFKLDINEYPLDRVMLNDKNGTKIPVSANLNHIKDDKGNINGMALIFRNLT